MKAFREVLRALEAVVVLGLQFTLFFSILKGLEKVCICLDHRLVNGIDAEYNLDCGLYQKP